ncbi:ParB/RepB/Spo0J family partition protein [Eisenbergiella sp.]
MATGFSVMDALNKNTKAGIDDSAPKARFRTKDISIFKMYSDSENFYPQEGIEQKAGEILMVGLLENLTVKYEPVEGRGEYKIISGERRWRALHLLVERGYKEFEFATSNITAPSTIQEERLARIIANSYRDKKVETMIREEQELKETLEEMKAGGIELKGYDLQSGRLRDVIADMLNISRTKVAQIEAVRNNLIPEFMEELSKNRLTFSAAYELSGMSSDEQREALAVLADTGELTYQAIKDMKEKKAAGAQIEGQISIEDVQQPGDTPLSYHGDVIGEDAEPQVSDSDTGDTEEAGFTGMNPPEENPTAGDEYQTPHPEGITSLCYSCTEYETCDVKTGTCTSCDQYKNRAEANKTDEQRYSEEQDAIDRETKRKLREQEEQEKMEHLPSDGGEKKNYVRISQSIYERIDRGIQSYMILKNDGYKEGDIVTLGEFSDGRATGRTLERFITCMDDDKTSSAIEEGFCVINLHPVTK